MKTASVAIAFLCVVGLTALLAACDDGESVPRTEPSPTVTDEVRTVEPRPTGTPDQATAQPTPTAIAGTVTATPTARMPSPTVETTPSPTAVFEEAATQLAYVDTDGNLWLVNVDGTGKRKLMEDCSPYWWYNLPLPFFSGLDWSPGGDRIACVSFSSITIVDTEGRSVARVERAGEKFVSLDHFPDFAWAPNGDAFAYFLDGEYEDEPFTDWRFPLVIADASGGLLIRFDDTGGQFVWSPDGEAIAFYRVSDDVLVVYDMSTEKDTVLAEGLRPLAWLAEGALMLVASDYQQGGNRVGYETSLLEVGNGGLTRVPELDSTQFWVSPDSWAIAFLARQPGAGASTMLSVLDLATRRVSPVEGSAIGFPSEGIPVQHVNWSADGAKIFFVDVRLETKVWTASRDGTGLTNLGTIGGMGASFSPDGTKVAYTDFKPKLPNVVVANADGSEPNVLADAGWPVAWQPAHRE